jgi:hypothetical protein
MTVIVAVVGYWVRSGLLQQSAAHDHSRVWSQFSQINLALRSYAQDHGQLPPLATVPQDSGDGLSWRILILPYLNESRLYQRFDLTKSWDSPKNLELLPEMPMVFSRVIEHHRTGKTACCALHFEGDWNGGQLLDSKGDLGGAVLLAESEFGREWTRPLDIELTPEASAVHTEVLAGGLKRPPIAIARNGKKIELQPGVRWSVLRCFD